jgi:hypothetical protein
MFAMPKTPKVLKYQSKPLISLKYRKQAGRPHNPKVYIKKEKHKKQYFVEKCENTQ